MSSNITIFDIIAKIRLYKEHIGIVVPNNDNQHLVAYDNKKIQDIWDNLIVAADTTDD